VRESGGGRVVSGDPAVFGQALRDLLDDPKRAEIGACGRRFVTGRFAWPGIAQQMEKEYLDLCNPPVIASPRPR